MAKSKDKLEFCNGPDLGPAATQDPELGVMTSSLEYKPGMWLNMKQVDRVKFCEHGRQTSHYITEYKGYRKINE